jgi:regulator of chromosome condensation
MRVAANISKKRKTTASSTEPTKKAKNTSSTMAPVAPTKKARAAPKTSAGKKSAATTKQAAPATKKSAATKTTAASKNTATAKSTASSSKKDTSVKKSTGTKRKAVDDDDQGEDKQPAKKKQTPAPKQTKAKERKVISSAPTERLKIFVFGEGSAGELGLGPRGNIIDVKRPRLNPFLPGDKVGVVQIAPGGMHCAALTHDNRILTWGVNDNGALGRNTKAGELLKSIDADDSDDVDGDRLNPLESTPGAIELDNVPEGTVFTSVAAGDSCTFALTDEGVVYGCGTFRVSSLRLKPLCTY